MGGLVIRIHQHLLGTPVLARPTSSAASSTFNPCRAAVNARCLSVIGLVRAYGTGLARSHAIGRCELSPGAVRAADVTFCFDFTGIKATFAMLLFLDFIATPACTASWVLVIYLSSPRVSQSLTPFLNCPVPTRVWCVTAKTKLPSRARSARVYPACATCVIRPPWAIFTAAGPVFTVWAGISYHSGNNGTEYHRQCVARVNSIRDLLQINRLVPLTAWILGVALPVASAADTRFAALNGYCNKPQRRYCGGDDGQACVRRHDVRAFYVLALNERVAWALCAVVKSLVRDFIGHGLVSVCSASGITGPNGLLKHAGLWTRLVFAQRVV